MKTTKFWGGLALAVFMLSWIFLSPAYAASLTGMSDRMTRQQISVGSNHEIRFTTPTGVDASTDTITLRLTGGNMSAVTFGDLDLFHGAGTGLETSETIAAAAAAGTWGATITGQTITLTAPTDAAPGEIAAGQKVVVRIGTNAVGGVNQIVNPGTANVYYLIIGGTFGDSGTLAFPVDSGANSVSVSASISAPPSPPPPDPGTGGGGDLLPPPPPPPAPPALTLSNIQVTSTDVTAIVTWDSSSSSTSLVDYGLTASYNLSESGAGGVTHHTVNISGLLPSTTYHFQVRSTDYLGRTATSTDATFSTQVSTHFPTNVSGFTATPSNAQVSLHWINPPDPDFVQVVLRARTDHFPTSRTDGRLVYQGSGTSMIDLGLTNGTHYFYAIYAINTADQASSGALADATPTAPPVVPPPVIPPVIPPTPPVIPPTPPTTPGGGTVTPPVTPPSGGGIATTTPPVIPSGVTVTTTVPTTTLPEITPPVVPTIPSAVTLHPDYYAAQGSLKLTVTPDNKIESVAGKPILVRIPKSDFVQAPTQATITVGLSTYALTLAPDGQTYAASFVPAANTASLPSTINATLADGTTITINYTLNVRFPGKIYEQALRQQLPLEGANIEVFEKIGNMVKHWDSTLYSQANPYKTGKDGTYAFYVPNGNYRLIIHCDDYQTVTKDIKVTNNILSTDIALQRSLIIPAQVTEVINSIRTPEVVQVTQNFVAPVAAVIAISTVATAASAFNILSYIYFLLTQPFLLVSRRKRLKWGLVYNSLTKMPIDLVIVRLIDAKTNKVVQTRITDASGRFAFNAKPGQYKIEVVKPGYIYPSPIMKNEKMDVDLVDLYHGEVIEVKDNTIITPNIPVDPVTSTVTPAKIIWKKYFRKIQTVLSLVSVVVSVGILIIMPSWLTGGLLAFQIASYFLFRRLAIQPKPKKWGIVYDFKTRKPLSRSVVRIFDKKFNKLLETQITDNDGKYGFFANKNIYYITAEHQGYAKYVSSELDLIKAKEAIIDQSVPLMAMA